MSSCSRVGNLLCSYCFIIWSSEFRCGLANVQIESVCLQFTFHGLYFGSHLISLAPVYLCACYLLAPFLYYFSELLSANLLSTFGTINSIHILIHARISFLPLILLFFSIQFMDDLDFKTICN